MIIERKLRTPGGTTVEIGNKEYTFNGKDDAPHVCEVKDTEHAEMLLAIDDGAVYVDVDATVVTEPAVTEPAVEAADLSGMTKAQMVAFAKDTFGADLNPALTVKVITQQIEDLRSLGVTATPDELI